MTTGDKIVLSVLVVVALIGIFATHKMHEIEGQRIALCTKEGMVYVTMNGSGGYCVEPMALSRPWKE